MTTINHMLDKFEKEVLRTLKPQTQKDYTWHIARLRHHFGEMHVDNVRPKDIGVFLHEGETGKICRNRSISVLSAAYTQAVGRWWMADRNPCLKVLRNPSEPRKRYIKDWEFKAVYDIAPPMIQIMMDLAYLTGQRESDLLRLTRENEWEQGVYFDQGKTGKKLIVGLTDALKAVMVRSRHVKTVKKAEFQPIFDVVRNSAGEQYTPAGFRSMWQRYMKKALSLGVLKEGFHFHDIRSKMVSDDKDVEVASKRAGHQNSQITKRVYDRNIRVIPALR